MKKNLAPVLISKYFTSSVLIVASLVGLSACGGFDDLDAARAAGAGIGSTVTTPNGPDTPTNPEIQSNWRYSSSEIGETIFSVSANNSAINSFVEPSTTIRRTPRVMLNKQLLNDLSIESVTIAVDSAIICLPSCDIRIRFNGQLAIYQMQDGGNGTIVPANDRIKTDLFRRFTTSNSAIVSLPIVGFGNAFDAEFNLRNYDPKRMALSP